MYEKNIPKEIKWIKKSDIKIISCMKGFDQHFNAFQQIVCLGILYRHIDIEQNIINYYAFSSFYCLLMSYDLPPTYLAIHISPNLYFVPL